MLGIRNDFFRIQIRRLSSLRIRIRFGSSIFAYIALVVLKECCQCWKQVNIQLLKFFLFKKIVKRFFCRIFLLNCEILNKIKNLFLDPGLSESELIDPKPAKSFGSLKQKDSSNVLCLYSLSLCSNDILNALRSPLCKIFCQNRFACLIGNFQSA